MFFPQRPKVEPQADALLKIHEDLNEHQLCLYGNILSFEQMMKSDTYLTAISSKQPQVQPIQITPAPNPQLEIENMSCLDLLEQIESKIGSESNQTYCIESSQVIKGVIKEHVFRSLFRV